MSQNSLIQSRDNLSTISLAVGIPVGAASEYSGGLTQVMTSHMLRNTKHKGEQELARYLDDNGIVPFSAVGKTIMYIGMNCPPQKVQQATDILEEILFQPEFKAETIAKITQQQKGGLQQLEQIAQARLFQRTRWEVAFGKSNITKIPTGTIEDLEKIDTESLEKHYQFLKSHQPKFVSVGVDNGEEHYSGLISRLSEFGDKVFDTPLRSDTVPPLNSQVDKMVQKTGNSYIGINFFSCGTDQSNYEDVVLNNLLSGGFASRMFVEIRDNRNLSYGAFSLNSKQKEFGLFTAAMDVTPARAPEAIEVALQVIKATLTEKIAEDELSRALKSAQKTALFVSDSSQSYTQYLMGRMMADLETDLDVINEKIVLAAQLDWQDTMLQYFTKNNLTLGIAGEPGDAEEQWGSIVEATL